MSASVEGGPTRNGAGKALRRREFLWAVSGATLGTLGLGRGSGGAVTESWVAGIPGSSSAGAIGVGPASRPIGVEALTIETVGVQLYTLRDPMGSDVEGTLAAVAEIGYREVELWRLHGLSPAAMKAMLDGLGLRAASSHLSLQEVRSSWPTALETASILGQSHIVCPSIPGRDRTPDGLRRVADDFNRAGEAARAAGIQFGYHNHDWEFAPVDGLVPYDLLLDRCDPTLVAMQMDLFWVVEGGADPLAYFAAHPGRFPTVHAKDRTETGRMVAVGRGVIDFPTILAEGRSAGLQHVFVEHDRPEDPLADVRASFEYLRAL